MKKILLLMAAAIVAVVLNSCTDDGNENSLVINNGNSEVTINRLGGIVQVPIAIDGEWTATISDNFQLPAVRCQRPSHSVSILESRTERQHQTLMWNSAMYGSIKDSVPDIR